MERFTYKNNEERIADAIHFLSQGFTRLHIKKAEKNFSLFLQEQILLYIAREYPLGTEVSLEIVKGITNVSVRMHFSGPELNVDSLLSQDMEELLSIFGTDAARKAFSGFLADLTRKNRLFNRYRGGLNTLTFIVNTSPLASLIKLGAFLLLGILTGVLLKVFVPSYISAFINHNLFSVVSKMFMRAVKMLVPPLMFFSIVSAICGNSNVSEVGRIGKKLLLQYLVNAVIGLMVAVGVVMLIKPGTGGSTAQVAALVAANSSSAAAVETASSTSVSLRDTILNIVPSNFIKAFTDANMLQIILISVLCGVAVGMLGEYKDSVRRFFMAGSRLFNKVVSLVMVFLPISVYCSMASMALNFGVDVLGFIMQWLLALLLAFLLMSLVYLVAIRIFAHIRPLKFLKAYAEALINTFVMGSCNSSLPICVEACEKKLGISRNVSLFSLPVGVSIHCCCNCLFYVISMFFLANLYTGQFVSPFATPMLLLSVLLLGIGAPSVPGAGPICVAMLLSQMGIPMEMIALIIALDPLVSMFKACTSSLEDACVTLHVAKSENALNRSVIG